MWRREKDKRAKTRRKRRRRKFNYFMASNHPFIQETIIPLSGSKRGENLSSLWIKLAFT